MILGSSVRKIELGIMVIALTLVAFSILMIYSIGAISDGDDPLNYAKKQLIWAVLGIAIMIGAALFDYSKLKTYAPVIYGGTITLLVTIILFGNSSLGAQRWISIGSFQLQPSEFAKLAIIISLAAFLERSEGKIDGVWSILLVVGITVVPILLIVMQPDLGTALVFVMIMLGILISAGIKVKHLAVILVIGILLLAIVFQFNILKDYQQSRLVVFLNPDIDPSGSGYNLRQSMIAIGSGGIFGKGLFSGTQSRLNFIPERHTDFIFSVIGEEVGLVGGGLLMLAFFLLLTRALVIGANSRNHFALLLATGISSMWAFQILINIGMTIGIMPITGIPLPFISYGGSSMMTNMFAVGLLLSIYARRFN